MSAEAPSGTKNTKVSLTRKNQAKLVRLVEHLKEHAQAPSEEIYWRHQKGKEIRLDSGGVRVIEQVIQLLQSVPEWKEAYPPANLDERLMTAYFAADDAEDTARRLLEGLAADCKAVRAFVPFLGFHLDPDIRLDFGPHVLRVLGEAGLQDEIIGRLREHLDSLDLDAGDRQAEIDRYRKLLIKHANVPVLVLEYHGSIDGAKEFITPIAEQVALFMQFCVGVLTDRFFEHPMIIDFSGSFTGDFIAIAPVMTVEFDRLVFANLRGNPWGCTITKANFAELEAMEILALAPDFVKTHETDNHIDVLLVRAMCAFADGERAVSKLSQMTAYVTAAEVFFSQKDRTTMSVTIGLAAANSTSIYDYEQNLALAEQIYGQRSDAVHLGLEPSAGYIARRLSLGAILRVIEMRRDIRTHKELRSWLDNYLPEREANCPRCGTPQAVDKGE